MVVSSKVSVSIITGFLGSGKTSLIKHLIANTRHIRFAIIINEFGDVGVDGSLLKACNDKNCKIGEIVELNNGCLCCTVADDFLPAFDKLLNNDTRAEHIIIETSGLALPKPLIKAFQWPEVRSKSTVDGVITIIDTPAYLQGIFAHDPKALRRQYEEDNSIEHDSPLEELFEDQLSCADIVILNKCDLLNTQQIKRAELEIQTNLRLDQKIIKSRNSSVNSEILLGIDAKVEDNLNTRPSHHDNAEDHEHDEFENFEVNFNKLYDISTIKAKLNELMRLDDVLRIKGILRVENKKAKLVIQGVGAHVDYYFEQIKDDNNGDNDAIVNKIVVIGFKGINKNRVDDILTRT